MSKLNIKIGQSDLKNPVILASGTFDRTICSKIDIDKLGGLITKTITLKPKQGNPLPHIYKTKYGWLNSVGLKNPGLKSYLSAELPFWQQFKTKIITSIGGDTEEEYIELAKNLNHKTEIIEVNISCPNVSHGGLAFGLDLKIVNRLTRKIRQHFAGTLIVKLSPNVADITQTAEAALSGGADALTIANTILGMEIDHQKQKPVFSRIVAGYSGGAIKPIILRNVYEVWRKFKCSILASGGIEDTNDALDFFLAGAAAVQIGSANFLKPATSVKIIDGLEKYIIQQKLTSLSKIKGSLR